ncbi:MAG: hypothetical protein LLF76_14560 [Planctomycetaceae bacterium]|nr:hypothetical protein [Planctomycetaceae bacterium]
MCRHTFFSLTALLAAPFLSAMENADKPLSGTTAEIRGEWMCTAYVEHMDDFTRDQEMPAYALFLKGIVLKDKGDAAWVFNDNCKLTARWDPEKITSILSRPALYRLKQVDGQSYLFVEWISNDVTTLQKAPCYYVLKKSTISTNATNAKPDVIGKWRVVDFVEKTEHFDPKQRSLNSLPPLRKLYFQADGTAWWIYQDNVKAKKNWSGDTIDYEPSFPAHFTLIRINDKDYLFVQWISGDVTIRGMKPWYYVLVKQE